MISIIVPVFNVEKYLCKCIESILRQSFKNWELILIDDGSTDESGRICDEYSKKDNRVKVIHQDNKGVSASRNIGLINSKGEYICFIDSDDYVEDDYLMKMIKIILSEDVDFVCCGVKNVKNSDIIIQSIADNSIINKAIIENHFFKNNIIKDLMYAPWNKLYKKKLLEEINFNENFSIGEDILFVYEYLQKCRNGYFLKDALYNYVYRADSAMNKDKLKRQSEYLKAAQYILNKCQDTECENDCKIWNYYHILNYVYSCNKLKINVENYKEYKKFLKDNKKLIFKLSNRLKIKYLTVMIKK